MVDAPARSLMFFRRDYPVREVGLLHEGRRIKRVYLICYKQSFALVVRKGVQPSGKAYSRARELTGPEAIEVAIEDQGVVAVARATAVRGLVALNRAVKKLERRLAYVRQPDFYASFDPSVPGGQDQTEVVRRMVEGRYQALYQEHQRIRTILKQRGWLEGTFGELLPLLTDGPLPPPTERVLLTRVAGVSHLNFDGTARQDVISAVCEMHGRRPRVPVALIREPQNPHDPYAVAVVHGDFGMFGYVPRDASEEIAERLDSGARVEALITSINGGNRSGQKLGVRIKITVQLA